MHPGQRGGHRLGRQGAGELHRVGQPQRLGLRCEWHALRPVAYDKQPRVGDAGAQMRQACHQRRGVVPGLERADEARREGPLAELAGRETVGVHAIGHHDGRRRALRAGIFGDGPRDADHPSGCGHCAASSGGGLLRAGERAVTRLFLEQRRVDLQHAGHDPAIWRTPSRPRRRARGARRPDRRAPRPPAAQADRHRAP
jgi:hypothetical protein